MADSSNKSPEDWSESEVSTWLRSFGVKEQYIEKLFEEEVNGQALLTLNEDFFKSEIQMKAGPAHLIVEKRNQLFNIQQNLHENKTPSKGKNKKLEKNNQKSVQYCPAIREDPSQKTLAQTQSSHEQCMPTTSKEDCRPRPFDQDGFDCIYIKHSVLQPESGAFNLIVPCHEFKGCDVAASLDRTRLQAKFAKEVLKFATGCMNIRTNGTIHFGVMDSNKNTGYMHGEIIGIPVKEKDIYVDALDYIKRCYSSDTEHVHQCVRPPRFIEVMDLQSTEKAYVIEVDIVPSIKVVKNKVFRVRLPNFRESSNKVEFEKAVILQRMGSKTESVSDEDVGRFYQHIKDRDALREEAERNQFPSSPEICQDLGRKLTMLMTCGKKFLQKEKCFILVTNKLKPDDLCNIDWLLNMQLFCVFDFDPDSNISGLCSKYRQHHAANLLFPQTFSTDGMSITEFTSKLHLFEQTSWIFCNGRNDSLQKNETHCDDMTWIKTKTASLRESMSLIFKQILPKGSFQVIFLLTSPVEKPLLNTFYEFFTELGGHEEIICICESETNFQKWQTFAEGLCGKEAATNFSVVGMKMSHINATLQSVQAIKPCAKLLPVFVKGTCFLEQRREEEMCSLEILTVNHCDETSKDFIDEEKANIEHQFYSGGRVAWLNFWLAEEKHVGEVIERDAYQETTQLLKNALKGNADGNPVISINIYHHPGSGGSTVARQVLWNNRKDLRCAVVKPLNPAAVVAQHAVELRECEEKDPHRCLPVLLLIEDSDKEYLDDLRNELLVAVNTKQIRRGTLCFILLSCRRSHTPEKKCIESALQNVSITHKLSDGEKRKFAEKVEALKKQYEPQFLLTFVLMSMEFTEKYLQQTVENLLQGIDHQSIVTRLICYVALLNTYVQNSFISQSHCEVLLGLTFRLERFRRHEFERSLSDHAKLIFLHLRDDRTHIQSVRIIHPLVAKEILRQLLGTKQTLSNLAKELLCEEALFKHRFSQEQYRTNLRELFIKRYRISRGDECDSKFSPLVEDVVKTDKSPDNAIGLLKEAFKRFDEDAFFAQQLARLHYTYEKFEEAIMWAEIAVKKLPSNSYILDTKGQVYKKWFQKKLNALEPDNHQMTAQNTADAVDTALTALECFHVSQRAAEAEMNSANCSGFFAEVEVSCSLLQLISSLQVFANKSERVKYLLTDYIPEEVEEAWGPFHGRLKMLSETMRKALEWISEDLSYFQTDIDAEEDETPSNPEKKEKRKEKRPLTWLARMSSDYGMYFSELYSDQIQQRGQLDKLTSIQKCMIIYYLGGGNMTSIMSKLTDQQDGAHYLEYIASLYPSNLKYAGLDQRDIVNYIVTHISLNCLSPQNSKVAPLKELQALCQTFPSNERCLPSALFLRTMLFWPEDHDTDHKKATKYGIVQSAIKHLEIKYWTKKKEIPQRKKRIHTHFLLGNEQGLNRFVHKTQFEKITEGLTFSEKRIKWFSGAVWKCCEVTKMLKRVSGWTDSGKVYLAGPQEHFTILPLHIPSVPHGNENVSFYVGFTLRGPVAIDITVAK